MMTPRAKRQSHNMLAHAIAALGAGIVLTELVRHWLYGHRLEGSVVAIGSGFGFIGAYMSDRARALEGGEFLVNSLTRVVAVVRSGRRATDAVVVTKEVHSTTVDTHEEER